jgi:hypothetical protein
MAISRGNCQTKLWSGATLYLAPPEPVPNMLILELHVITTLRKTEGTMGKNKPNQRDAESSNLGARRAPSKCIHGCVLHALALCFSPPSNRPHGDAFGSHSAALLYGYTSFLFFSFFFGSGTLHALQIYWAQNVTRDGADMGVFAPAPNGTEGPGAHCFLFRGPWPKRWALLVPFRQQVRGFGCAWFFG